MNTQSRKLTHSTGCGPRRRLPFNEEMESYAIWETRFTNYIYTTDKGMYKAILPFAEEEEEDDTDFADKNRGVYAELV